MRLSIVTLAILGAFIGASSAAGSSLWPPPDYSGDLLHRPTLTGDWWGRRTKLAEHGITFDIDLLQIYQNIVDGDNTGGEYGGSADYNLYFDFEKMGLWPGGFLRAYGETQYGDSVIGRSSILATNADALLPLPNRDISALSALTYYQFLSEHFGIFLGKLETFDGDTNAFASARGKKQFMHQNFVINPVLLMSIPYSGLGGGIMVLPTKTSIFTLLVMDREGSPTAWNFDTLFKDATSLAAEFRIGIHLFFGLPGHQLAGFTWTNKDSVELDQRILVPGSGRSRDLETKSDQWAFYYNFDQYLYVDADDDKQGFGLFGRFGAGDPDTNPIEWFVSIGLGGMGLIPGRPRDAYGIGYYFGGLNGHLGNRRVLNRSINRLQDGHGFEVFYNIEITPWLYLSPDLQVVEPGLERRDTAVLLGGRCLLKM